MNEAVLPLGVSCAIDPVSLRRRSTEKTTIQYHKMPDRGTRHTNASASPVHLQQELSIHTFHMHSLRICSPHLLQIQINVFASFVLSIF